jgi:hypothetical protein
MVRGMNPRDREDANRRLAELESEGVDIAQLRLWRSWSVDERLQHLEEFLADMAILREEARLALNPRAQP